MIKRLLLLVALVLLGGHTALADTSLRINVDHGVALTLSGPAASVFIANPDIADVQVMSPTSIMIFGKRTGETTFMASDSNGHTLAQRNVLVVQDLSDLRQELDNAIPGNKIKAQALPNGIVLTGEAKDASAVADAYKLAQRYITSGGDIINRIKVVGSNQINIRVRFAEVSRSVNNTLGIDWQSAANVGGFVFGLGTGNFVQGASGGSSVLSSGLFNRPLNPSTTLSNDVVGLSHQGKNMNINSMIDALAQNNLVTILAEPNLTAMSGETASFIAGGEIPIPIVQASSGNVPIVTIEWKEYGVSLEFTPTLISENRINLHVKPQSSQLTQVGAVVIDGVSVPGINKRMAETTVEVASGESFAIAGLIDNSQTQTVNELPVLGDLPVLGALFRSNQFQNGQTELVVVITPYIVTPSGKELALPTDGYSPPNETERFLGLRYNSSDPNARPMSGATIAKPVTAAPAMPAAVDVPVTPPPSPVPSPMSDTTPGLQPAVVGSSVTTAKVTRSTTVSVLPPPSPTDVPSAATLSDPMAAAAPAAAVPAAPVYAPAPAPLAAQQPVTIQPTANPVALSPAKATSAPLRGAGNGTNGAAPVGPGGFLVE